MNISQTDPALVSAATGAEVSVAVAVKQQDAVKQEGQAAVALLEGARQLQAQQTAQAAARGGIDLSA
jgi:hypothetical protein